MSCGSLTKRERVAARRHAEHSTGLAAELPAQS
jgi:hypothetical protein